MQYQTDLMTNSTQDMSQSYDYEIDCVKSYIKLNTSTRKRARIFYHADADGLMSAWLYSEILRHLGIERIISRAVWNHEFTFSFLEKIIVDKERDFSIFTDLPVVQELKVLRSLSSCIPCYIYDHHKPPNNLKLENNTFLYQNSLLFTRGRISWPASYFASLVHESLFGKTSHSILLATIGLIGDNSLERFEEVQEKAINLFPNFISGKNIWDSQAGKLCSSINIIFKANPRGLSNDLCELMPLSWEKPLNEIESFLSSQNTSELSELLEKEVYSWMSFLEEKSCRFPKDLPLVFLTNMKSFAVGIVASKAISDGLGKFIALGFNFGKLIQYEFRASTSARVSVLKLFKSLQKEYKPLSCGGHEYAGGMLIEAKDDEKVRSLITSHYMSLQK